MFALEECDPAPGTLADQHAGHMTVGVAADDMRPFSRQGQKVLRVRQTVLAEKRAIARGDFKEASFSRRTPTPDVDSQQAQDQATRRQQRQGGGGRNHGQALLTSLA